MVFIVGETHGWNRNLITHLGIKVYKSVRPNSIFKDIPKSYAIQVGNFGAIEEDLHKIKAFSEEFLEKDNIHMFVVRGHTDDAHLFDNRKIGNITLVADYSVLELEGYKILCIGGGVTDYRSKSNDFMTNPKFKNQKINLDLDLLNKIEGVDTLITYEAPDFCKHRIDTHLKEFCQDLYKDDTTLFDDIVEERKKITKIVHTLRNKNIIKYHYYGRYESDIKIDYGCFHVSLDDFQVVEIRK